MFTCPLRGCLLGLGQALDWTLDKPNLTHPGFELHFLAFQTGCFCLFLMGIDF